MILAERAARLQSEARTTRAEADLTHAHATASRAEALIAYLRLEVEKLRRSLYGVRSERKERLLDQLEMQLEDAEANATEDELAAERSAPSTTVGPFQRKRPARKPFPEHLPRERIVIAAPATCPCCGWSKLSKLGEDVTQTLEVIPRQWKVIQTVRERFSCRQCETISQPPAPFHVTSRGFAGPNLLAMVLFEKFGQHQPLNRQSERYAREGIDLSLSTLADQVGACAAALRPLYALIEGHVMGADRLHGDDTTVPILAKGRTETGRVWAYVRDDRPFGGQAPPAALFYASRDRRRELLSAIWPTRPAFCKPTPTAATTASIFPTGSPLRSSRRCAGAMRGGSSSSLPTSPRAPGGAKRRRRSRRSLWRRSNASMPSSTSSARSTASPPPSALPRAGKGAFRWSARSKRGCAPSAPRLSRHAAVAKAIDYILTRWPSFIRFLDDGRICLSNNAAERALRSLASEGSHGCSPGRSAGPNERR